MKYMLKSALAMVICLISVSAAAQTVSAWGDTLSDAEAKIARKAEQAGMSYTITSARVGWVTYVTATLNAPPLIALPDSAPVPQKPAADAVPSAGSPLGTAPDTQP